MTAFVKALVLRTRPGLYSFSQATRRQRNGIVHTARRSKTTMMQGFPNNLNDNTGNNDKTRVFEELVDFPCIFTFKVIGMAQGNFMSDIVDSVALALETDKKYLKTSFRDRGKYRSITLRAAVNTADQIYDVYAAIDRDPRVKFKF